MTISVDDPELRQRILAGRFLTTIYDIELDGKKHRVIPRDFQLDPVRDFPIHVDFLRLGEGATIRVSVPCTSINGGSLAGREARRHGQHRDAHHRPRMLGREHSAVHRGRCRRARNQPSLHLSDIKLPDGVKRCRARMRRWSPSCRRRATRKNRRPLPLLRLPSGCCGGSGAAPAAGAAAAAPAAGCCGCRRRGAKAPAGGGDKKK